MLDSLKKLRKGNGAWWDGGGSSAASLEKVEVGSRSVCHFGHIYIYIYSIGICQVAVGSPALFGTIQIYIYIYMYFIIT